MSWILLPAILAAPLLLPVAVLTPLNPERAVSDPDTYYGIKLTCPAGPHGVLEHFSRRREGRLAKVIAKFSAGEVVEITVEMSTGNERDLKPLLNFQADTMHKRTESENKTFNGARDQTSLVYRNICISGDTATKRRYRAMLETNRAILEGRLAED